MSDAELSDINDDDDIVRKYENNDIVTDNRQDNEQDGYVSAEEVNADGSGYEEKKKVKPPKKRTLNKRFVLNTERLKGPKGIHTIEKLYEGFKFQGKGHEKEDLDKVMKRLEYWAFRLYPKLHFDDFLDKCEHLGHKKDLQTHLKRYRLGLLSADDIRPEFIVENDDDDDRQNNSDIQRTENQSRSEITTEIEDAEFQRLFDEVDQQQHQQLELTTENI
ncbi:protein TIPIN homolog [Phymastichus coffea]|uniref:protein TIPIN homolog n=1 Tax=Phymastichus coffea TaxID=108790 RepID=UPI00273C19CD|nr:protein TIPIN homolog [Phymastichus coffea]